MDPLTEEIIGAEWALFDRVRNRGGRADCQDDYNTFRMMRGSQLEAWTDEMRRSYREDLLSAKKRGGNPLAEKYGYMMRWTYPAEYEEIRGQLPEVSGDALEAIDKICRIQTAWQEELAAEFPALTGRGRPVRQRDCADGETAFETYLRGELATYSLRTLTLYRNHVEDLRRQGENMNRAILENTVRQYGFVSLEAAEAGIR